MFRNVVDSGRIRCQDDVTCLVGKNESGKTALLVALHRLNPANASQGFVVQEDYPRWRLSRDRKADEIDTARPIEATFELGETDVAAVESDLWPGVLSNRSFTYYTTYGRQGMRILNVDEAAGLRSVFELLGTPDDLQSELLNLETIDSALRHCEQLLQDSDDEDKRKHASRIVTEIKEKLNGKTLRSRVADILQARMPKFFYFSDYQTLPGRIDLDDAAASDEQPGTSAMQTARALLRLAGTKTEAIKEEDFDARKSELEAASNELTQQVFEYWTQNPHLSVEIDTDKETVERGGYQGQTAVVKYLDVRVKDSRHGFTGNFEQRSQGFQWFFSFFAAFSEFEEHGHDVIVLLDEPALSLHGRAQADFLRFINERLGARSQVVYTTHSPFMVEPNRLDRVRIVEDRGPKYGATVTEDVHSVGHDATFPLQAALGYDIAQNLLIGPDNLLLEGASDDTYLRIMSDHLKSLGREGLDDRWRLLSTHGATNMPAFVSLFDNLDVTLVIDGTSKSIGKLDNLVKAKALPAKRIINTDTFTRIKQSDIEDMYTPGEYLRLYNAAFGTNVRVGDLNGRDRIIARVGRATGEEFVKHGKPAEELLRMRDRDKFLRSLTKGTVDKWESLFAAINKTLSS
jgi:predicted ATP-dependent endonuclease of OLD family